VDALGAVASSQNRKLETVAYRLTFHYFSGIQEWNLVLQADSPTQRDGQFSNNKLFENAWYFDQKYTDTDLTAVKPN
jgi:starvation-inducible outer membrane lipoprotein